MYCIILNEILLGNPDERATWFLSKRVLGQLSRPIYSKGWSLVVAARCFVARPPGHPRWVDEAYMGERGANPCPATKHVRPPAEYDLRNREADDTNAEEARFIEQAFRVGIPAARNGNVFTIVTMLPILVLEYDSFAPIALAFVLANAFALAVSCAYLPGAEQRHGVLYAHRVFMRVSMANTFLLFCVAFPTMQWAGFFGLSVAAGKGSPLLCLFLSGCYATLTCVLHLLAFPAHYRCVVHGSMIFSFAFIGSSYSTLGHSQEMLFHLCGLAGGELLGRALQRIVRHWFATAQADQRVLKDRLAQIDAEKRAEPRRLDPTERSCRAARAGPSGPSAQSLPRTLCPLPASRTARSPPCRPSRPATPAHDSARRLARSSRARAECVLSRLEQIDAEKERLTYELLIEQKRAASAGPGSYREDLRKDCRQRPASSVGTNSELAELLCAAEAEPPHRLSRIPGSSAWHRGRDSASLRGDASSVVSEGYSLLSSSLNMRLDESLRSL